MPQPNSGRMGLSPWAVLRTMRMASSTSLSRATRASPPLASVLSGNASPLPMNSSPMTTSSTDRHGGALELRRARGRERETGLGLDRDVHAVELDVPGLGRQLDVALLGGDGDARLR